ncbi:hypothetical protein PHISP_05758 [Aspergillus sp. HF37]|nr:hypothetical protein PHISP_05758 [Aspergillus sp. HF37]
MPHNIPDVVNQPSDNPQTTATRPSGSAGYASVEALAGMENNDSGRLLGTGSGGVVTAPGSSAALNNDVLENAGSDRPLSQEEADRMYEARMEEEYAKREGERATLPKLAAANAPEAQRTFPLPLASHHTPTRTASPQVITTVQFIDPGDEGSAYGK